LLLAGVSDTIDNLTFATVAATVPRRSLVSTLASAVRDLRRSSGGIHRVEREGFTVRSTGARDGNGLSRDSFFGRRSRPSRRV